MLVEADYDYPKFIGHQADSTYSILEDDVVAFRVGVPGPVDGSIDSPLVEQVLTRSGAKTASATVPAASLRFDPGDYAYHVWIQRLGVVARGIFRLNKSLGRGPDYA